MTHEEFEQLYLNHSEYWIEVLQKLTRSRELAEDALQGTITQLLARGLDKIHTDQNAEAFIRQRSVLYVKRYIWTNPENVQHIEKNLAPIKLIANVADPTAYCPDADRDAAEKETPLEQAVREALSDLKPLQQDVVRLVACGGLTYRDVGAQLHCSPKVAENLYLRALPKLRLALENVYTVTLPSSCNTAPLTDETAA